MNWEGGGPKEKEEHSKVILKMVWASGFHLETEAIEEAGLNIWSCINTHREEGSGVEVQIWGRWLRMESFSVWG